MPDSWPDTPNTPKLSSYEYLSETYGFRGILISAILHGIVVVLFYQCMRALLSPTNHKHKAGGIRWGLVALTTAMFLFSTAALTLNLDALSSLYINNRVRPNLHLPGSLGYLNTQETLSTVLTSLISLNQWLADGLLLYRCHVLYTMNYRVTAFPCLMYLASVSLGIVFIHASSQRTYLGKLAVLRIIPLYIAITFSLNVLLTVMIVARLALYNQQIQAVMGTSSRAGERYKAIATIFVESCAPYAISLLLYLIAHSIESPLMDIFYPIFIETQVIAPFLIILRLANRTAVTNDSTIGSRTVDPACFRNHEETTCGHGVFPDEGPVGSTDVPGEVLNGLSVRDGKEVKEVPKL